MNVAQESTLAQTNFELLALRTFTENGLPNSIATALAQGLTSEGMPLLTSDQEAIKGLQTLNELMAQAVENTRGDEENPLYITTTDPLPVEIKGGEITVKGQVDANVVNESPIPVSQQGTVSVRLVGSDTTLSVRIEDLGTLLNQLSQQNTASDSFGGTTI